MRSGAIIRARCRSLRARNSAHMRFRRCSAPGVWARYTALTSSDWTEWSQSKFYLAIFLPTAIASLASPAAPQTQKGEILGTFRYMSPEQLQGRDADGRSDIFAFGAVLYEMATGKRAFEGKSQLSVASAILEKEPQPVSSLQKASPPALDHVIATCLAKNPDERWQCAADVARELVWIAQAPTR